MDRSKGYENWRTNFWRPATAVCKNEFCDNIVHTTRSGASRGVYCKECKLEAKRLRDKLWYDSRGRRLRKAQRASRRA